MMDFLKRFCIYTGIILLCISIYKDIANDTLKSQDQHDEILDESDETSAEVSVIKMKTKPGDTVLSITEKINDSLDNQLNVQEILSDFQEYNPTADPNNLQANHYYYFLDYNI